MPSHERLDANTELEPWEIVRRALLAVTAITGGKGLRDPLSLAAALAQEDRRAAISASARMRAIGELVRHTDGSTVVNRHNQEAMATAYADPITLGDLDLSRTRLTELIRTQQQIDMQQADLDRQIDLLYTPTPEEVLA